MLTATIPGFNLLASCGDYLTEVREKGFMDAVADHAADRVLTLPILFFDLFVIGAAIAVFLLLNRFTRKLWKRAAVMATGVFLFELFTAPMWINDHLGRWAYVYCDLSWILTLGWTTLIMGVVVLVDRWLSHWSEPRRFFAYLGILLVLVTIAEMVVVGIGIRSYAPEVLATVSGIYVLGVPLEILYYVPVFTALVIAFYKYWNFVIDDAALVPVKKRKWLRAILIAFVGVFLFELLIEPMVQNKNFPEWSYVYNDISILMTGTWVLLIAVAAVVIDRFLIGASIPLRFAAALLLISALALPIESWLIVNGYRVYGESTVMDFSGFTTPITGVAVEVAFAIPCYLALIIGFIRYWEIVLDNRL
jgi:hypothetical protein